MYLYSGSMTYFAFTDDGNFPVKNFLDLHSLLLFPFDFWPYLEFLESKIETVSPQCSDWTISKLKPD